MGKVYMIIVSMVRQKHSDNEMKCCIFYLSRKKSEEKFTLRGVWQQGMQAKCKTLGVEYPGLSWLC